MHKCSSFYTHFRFTHDAYLFIPKSLISFFGGKLLLFLCVLGECNLEYLIMLNELRCHSSHSDYPI